MILLVTQCDVFKQRKMRDQSEMVLRNMSICFLAGSKMRRTMPHSCLPSKYRHLINTLSLRLFKRVKTTSCGFTKGLYLSEILDSSLVQ